MNEQNPAARAAANVLGGELEECSRDPMTGWHRDGCCATGPGDTGVHTVCAVVTDDFLEFSSSAGNDLSTPRPEFGFPGLVAGDGWCVCAPRWQEAFDAGHAPPVRLRATHIATLEWCDAEALRSKATDLD